jgi:glycosyltransferase involved in cell wall biosynthesis
VATAQGSKRRARRRAVPAPLRVCMVHYSDFHVDSRLQRQARALAERGDEVDCICLSEPAELAVGGGRVRLHHVSAARQRRRLAGYLGGYARFFGGALKRVSTLDRQRRFDVVEVHNMPDFLTLTALRPKLRGVPVLLNVHDTFPELFGTLFGLGDRHPLVRLIELEERLGAGLADSLLFVTDQARDRLRARGVDARSVRVVMNTPDERLFGPPQEPVEVPRRGPLRVVYHGGLGARFGVRPLVRAFGLLAERDRHASLDIYGSDPDQASDLARLASQVAPQSVRVAPKPTPVGLIPARLRQSHVGVVPTVRDRFTELLLPVKLLECVHMGLPVVASRLPVIESYFSDDELLLVEPGSPHAIAEAIAEIRRDPAAAQARARRASERLRPLRWDVQRARYLQLIDELAARGAGARSAEREQRGSLRSGEEVAL